MKLTAVIKVFGAVLGRWLVRWLEMLGENPPLGRDCGIGSWHYLHLKQVREEACSSQEEASKRGIEPVVQRRSPGEPEFDREARSAAVSDLEVHSAVVTDLEVHSVAVSDGEVLRGRDGLRAH